MKFFKFFMIFFTKKYIINYSKLMIKINIIKTSSNHINTKKMYLIYKVFYKIKSFLSELN
jgi:hypothetical protein